MDVLDDGNCTGGALGLSRVGVGRVLGVGSGRKFIVSAVAHRNSISSLCDGASPKRNAKGVECCTCNTDVRSYSIGTFLTRSGIVQSVHAFAETDIGWVFLVYLRIIIVSSFLVIWLRRDLLRPERFIESLLSLRKVAFLTNNLILVGICFAVFWGVMFPVFSEALTGEKQTVGIPFFNKVTIPLFLLLIFTMAIGPLVPWRKADVARIVRLVRGPIVIGILVSSIFLFGGVNSFYATLSYGLCTFLIFSIGGQFHQGVRAQHSARETLLISYD